MSNYRLSGPLSVQIELTQRCNLRCFHCYNYWKNIDGCAMADCDDPEDVILAVVNNVLNMKINDLIITGGEPFLRKDILFKVIDLAVKNGVFVGINTNATLINEDDARLLHDKGINSVLVSVLGLEDMHDSITGVAGSFVETIRGIRLLRDNNINVSTNIVVSKRNISEVYDLAKVLKGLGIKTFCATPMLPPNANLLRSMIDTNELKDMLRVLLKIKEELSMNVDVLEPLALCIFHKNEVKYFSEFIGARTCSAGISFCVVSSNGDARACVHDSNIFGNILSDGFDSVWAKMSTWSDPKILPKTCKKCRSGYICGGGCRMSAEFVNNSFFGNDRYMTERLSYDVSTILSHKDCDVHLFNPKLSYMFNNSVTFRKEEFGYVVLMGGGVLFITDYAFDLIKNIKALKCFSFKDVVNSLNLKKVSDKKYLLDTLEVFFKNNIIIVYKEAMGENHNT